MTIPWQGASEVWIGKSKFFIYKFIFKDKKVCKKIKNMNGSDRSEWDLSDKTIRIFNLVESCNKKIITTNN